MVSDLIHLVLGVDMNNVLLAKNLATTSHFHHEGNGNGREYCTKHKQKIEKILTTN